MAQEGKVLEKRLNQILGQEARKIEQDATQTVAIVGKKVESVVTRKQWENWFRVEARIYELNESRMNDLPIATELTRISVLGNTWKGMSVIVGEAEEKNQVQPNITTFPAAVERLKDLTQSRISPMVVHPDGGHEVGYYLFDNDQGSGIIFIDDDSVMNMDEIVDNLSEDELVRLSKLKMQHKQNLIGGENDGSSGTVNFSAAEVGALDQLKAKYQAGEIEDDSQSTALTISELGPEEDIQEVKELVDFDHEITRLKERFGDRRVTLTAIIYRKPTKLETPTETQNNAQATEFITNNAPTPQATPVPIGDNPFGSSIPDFGKYVSFAPGIQGQVANNEYVVKATPDATTSNPALSSTLAEPTNDITPFDQVALDYVESEKKSTSNS